MVRRRVVLKLTGFVKRKEGMSFEEFDHHWTNNHGPLLASLPIFKEKLIKYSQIHVRQTDMNSSLSKGLPMMMGYDGIMEAYAEKMEDFVALFESEEYKSLVIPDEERFVDRSQFKMFIGYEEIHWDRDDDKSFSS
ncbi:hypothetical protein MPTK1_1g08330 [Marchantia polymorpha subsp. ruderalis]|uniref:EthD domain-containing protein n=2 Tax=Marchantia polymorpha TaxID=3197 RepID=A0AAF6AMW8_MARPO|nr:hypothetical protein MARPO_0036s0076 [Marchantia polymorpha]BBM97788.1 hypothetical protein Mp_1g08330 [Marchantia polymorpha subsp. ruderalis]|eukprot:PTQ41091.1 hypothetical protein MARPO_0036s0076 [Marchantia polymorpha]